MANEKSKIVVFRGKTSFAKILGAPLLNYAKDGKEWKMDLVISKDTAKEAKALGIGDRVKTKTDYVNGQPYMTFKQAELRKDGVTKNNPIKVVDIAGNPWPSDKLIGNESDVDVKFAINDFGPGKKHGVYIRSVRVLKLVPYEQEEFAPIEEDDEFFNEIRDQIGTSNKAADDEGIEVEAEDGDLDDEIPF